MEAAEVGTTEAISAAELGTANERFKKRFAPCLSVGIILATLIHFALVQFFPTLTAADVSYGGTRLEAVDLPPEVDVPPAPEVIDRPAIPVVARAQLYEDVTMAPTTFEENPVQQLPPPPADASFQLRERPVFTPYTVAPRLRHRGEAANAVLQRYPKLLQDAGVEGTVIVWAFIDDRGVVKNCQLHTSCGIAALEAVREFEFVPALNNDVHVPVWISMPITFTVVGTAG